MTGNDQKSPIEVSSDEDWKNRVKAEDAALDQEFRQPAETAKSAQTSTTEKSTTEKQTSTTEKSAPRSTGPELPEPSIETLIGLLSTQAMVALGILPNPVSRKAERELTTARYFIDLLSVVEQKTAGNLTRDEAEALDGTLHSLRMTFVQRSKETVSGG